MKKAENNITTEISFKDFKVIMKNKLKEQGINETLIALAWNIVEVKQELIRLYNKEKGK